MSEIKNKIIKEVEGVVGYRCDICGNEYKKSYKGDDRFSIIEYIVLTGGYGERHETITKHLCSGKCIIKALKSVPFDCNIKLENKQIEDLLKEMDKNNG